MFELIDRRAYKQKAAEVLRTASVPAQIMTAFYMALLILLSLFDSMAQQSYRELHHDIHEPAVLGTGGGFWTVLHSHPSRGAGGVPDPF